VALVETVVFGSISFMSIIHEQSGEHRGDVVSRLPITDRTHVLTRIWVARLKARRRAQLFSAESGTACAAAWKPIFEWVPSQNGLFVDAPQRHSTVLS
jgi:hypothetical protein